ncbi:ORF42 [Agrotis segetum granulovirus]|uniref:ORF42 n=1 Tax=Agrotis segetum granulosis virus TaxID=10464 RepID=Q6QXK1_GVAS|nr:P13 [Agrotis segetum granulovirus]AAS82696.1 ORF42 [Agrotis segetum granulovirus]AHN92087.1 p13 [Agrotis segetum granulovirus]AKN63322.1 P13 [Agrotis segetum granulovirus]
MKCAYVTLIMLGDKYVPGAVALANSLSSSGSYHDRVCLVTKDVTLIAELERVFDKVIQVEFIHYKCGNMLTSRQEELYSSWIDYSFTKWRCLELTQYSKCVYLDADQIVLKNIDHLFNLITPAMCFNHNYNETFKKYKYGKQIVCLKEIFDNSTVLGFTGTFVYAPCVKLFQQIKALLTPNNRCLLQNKYNNGFEEVVLAQAMIALKIIPTQLSPMYLWNAGDYMIIKRSQPYVINYYGEKKPWCGDIKFMDEYIWWWFYKYNKI